MLLVSHLRAHHERLDKSFIAKIWRKKEKGASILDFKVELVQKQRPVSDEEVIKVVDEITIDISELAMGTFQVPLHPFLEAQTPMDLNTTNKTWKVKQMEECAQMTPGGSKCCNYG